MLELSVWRGNWDKNAIESHFISHMSLDQTSFYPTIFFMSLDRMSFYRTIFFMSLDRTSCHWIGLHAIGSNFMSLDQTSCHWIGLHAIGSDFMPLDRTSCYWIMHHSNGRCGCCPLRQLIGIYVIGLEFMSLDHTYIILSDHNTLCATISLFHLILHYLSAQIPTSASAL